MTIPTNIAELIDTYRDVLECSHDDRCEDLDTTPEAARASLESAIAELAAERDAATTARDGMERERDACCSDYQKEAARAVAAEQARDELLRDLRVAVQMIREADDRSAKTDEKRGLCSSPFCNGNHHDSACEGDYMTRRWLESVDASIARAQPEQPKKLTTHADLRARGIKNHDEGRVCFTCGGDVPSGFRHEHGPNVCAIPKLCGVEIDGVVVDEPSQPEQPQQPPIQQPAVAEPTIQSGECSFFDQLPKGPALGRFSASERAELDELKRKAFKAGEP